MQRDSQFVVVIFRDPGVDFIAFLSPAESFTIKRLNFAGVSKFP